MNKENKRKLVGIKRMEDREKYLQLRSVFINIIFFLVTLIVVVISSYLYTKDMVQIIRNGVVSAICLGSVIFLLSQARINHSYADDNEELYLVIWF